MKNFSKICPVCGRGFRGLYPGVTKKQKTCSKKCGAVLRYSALQERFDAGYVVAEDGCWLWVKGKTQDGYGSLSGGGQTTAHRVSWRLHHGVIPNRLQVLHRCDVPACVNPAHLFLGTNRDNVADREAKGRGALKIGEDHPQAKMTWAAAREIRRSYAAGGESLRSLAKKYNIAHTSILGIIHKRRWAEKTNTNI